MVADLKISRLGSFGIQRGHFAGLVARAANASSMKANPIVLTPEELTETLEQAL
jgi:alcohol dehydrogenase class IV